MAILEAMVVAMISLNGSHWVGTDNARQSVQFSDQNIFGNAGCNQFNGAYRQSKDGFTVSRLATTRMACKKEIMARENQFIWQIENTKSVELTESLLILKGADGSELVRLTRKQLG
jgi:heat shock protein HslJ